VGKFSSLLEQMRGKRGMLYDCAYFRSMVGRWGEVGAVWVAGLTKAGIFLRGGGRARTTKKGT